MTMLIIGALVGGLVWLLTLFRPKPLGAVIETKDVIETAHDDDDDSDITQHILISRNPRRRWLVTLVVAVLVAFLLSSSFINSFKKRPIPA